MPKPTEGTWTKDDLRRAFVAGASWWEFHWEGATMWPSDRRLAEAEADRRYPKRTKGYLNAFIAFIRRA